MRILSIVNKLATGVVVSSPPVRLLLTKQTRMHDGRLFQLKASAVPILWY